jgi:hypothetical protein
MREAKDSLDVESEKFETESIKPLKKNIAITTAGLAWVPYYDVGGGKLEAATEA